jgi:hypothetical protein
LLFFAVLCCSLLFFAVPLLFHCWHAHRPFKGAAKMAWRRPWMVSIARNQAIPNWDGLICNAIAEADQRLAPSAS